MQVGDLVKLINNSCKDSKRIGIVTEFTCHGENGPLASGWVQWAGNSDRDIEYVEDLEVISASR